MDELYTGLKGLFRDFYNAQSNSSVTPLLKQIRQKAFSRFQEIGFPSTKDEKWRKTKLKSVLELSYQINTEDRGRLGQLKSLFECEINNFDTDLYTTINGWHEDRDEVSTKGVIITSMLKAETEFPELFYRYFNKLVTDENNGFLALNTALFTDGYFVYIPDNVSHERILQIVNVIDSKTKIFVNTRNMVIIGKNASLKLVHCDDSLSSFGSFANTVTEFFIDEGGSLDFYKLQNKDEKATVVTHNFIEQQRDSNARSNTITFNGGIIRNDTSVLLAGKGANADVYGLYLVDKEQFIDNQVKIDHAASDCTSSQLFKGIADENAKAMFNGHILVRPDAQRTLAYQNNRSIQLTDTATIDTHPFLEIYADDVKCSHGATIGQLDEEAMFYMRQRGICERNARMLLMYSFVGEVIDKIELPVLKDRVGSLVSRRLKGELHACENCALSCENPDSVMTFEIDMSKI